MKKDFHQLKHPLVQAFGLALKSLRKVEAKSARDTANALGVGESLYRLLESGSAVLQPNKALDLIRAFPQSRIDFTRLSMLLVMFQVITSSRPKTINEATAQANQLSEVSEEAEELFNILRPIWIDAGKYSDSRTISSKIEKNDIPRSLLIFLAQTPTHGNDDAPNLTWITKQIKDTPPLFLDLASKIIGSLRQYSQLMNVQSVSAWEREHRGRIRTVCAFVESLDDIIETCHEFDWDFFTDDRFSRLVLVCFGSPDQHKREQTNLKTLKRKIREKILPRDSGAKKISDKVEGSIKLVFVSDQQLITAIRANLDEETTDTRCRHVWIYELSPEAENLSERYFVAIMDDRAGSAEKYSCIHCSTKQTQAWFNLMNQVSKEDVPHE